MIIRNTGKLTELSSENGYIHRIGTDTYFKKGIVLSIDGYEEVMEVPKYTRQEYVEKVRELIKEKYSIEDEIALYRQKDSKLDEFEEYNTFCENCKAEAKKLLSEK